MSLLFLLLAAAAPAAADARSDDIVVIAPLPAPLPALAEAPIVPNRTLATMRGGIRLDNGFDIAIGIDIQTRVDGLLLLHTIYASDGPTAGVRVYTDGDDQTRLAPGTVTVNLPGDGSQPVAPVVDRSPTGTRITIAGPGDGATVNILTVEPGQWLNANGQQRVPVAANGAGVTQGPGTFTLAMNEQGSIVTLDADMLTIRHLVGQATGVAVANTGSDRVIDTVSSVNVDLQGIAPTMFDALFTADQLAFDAMSRR